MKRTVKETFAHRLMAQKKEASVQGLKKVAENLDHVCSDLPVRDDEASYTYVRADVQADVEKPLWAAAVRLADYYDCPLDAERVQLVIEKLASELTKEIRVLGGVNNGVGAYEPKVPGEVREKVKIEIE